MKFAAKKAPFDIFKVTGVVIILSSIGLMINESVQRSGARAFPVLIVMGIFMLIYGIASQFLTSKRVLHYQTQGSLFEVYLDGQLVRTIDMCAIRRIAFHYRFRTWYPELRRPLALSFFPFYVYTDELINGYPIHVEEQKQLIEEIRKRNSMVDVEADVRFKTGVKKSRY